VNYYDELGLHGSASAEEIRQAYKRLARLLHPDQQSDEQLRKMAELQMMRLNEIQAVLTDPEERLRYDESLDAALAGEDKWPRRIELSPPTMIWATVTLGALCAFVFGFFYFQQDSGPAPAPVPSPTVVARPATKSVREPQSQYRAPMVTVQKPPALRRREIPPAPEPVPQGPVYAEEQHQAAPVLAVAPVVEAAAKPAPSLIGTWLYVKSDATVEGAKKFSYRPEYIEMIIKPARDGRIYGRYRGQFQVPDQALSPEIIFQFEGVAGEGTNVYTWHANDGASGQIRLNVVSEASIEVSWYTTTFGKAPKLASGRAILYRN